MTYRNPAPRVRAAGAGLVFLCQWGHHDRRGWAAAVAWLEGPPLNCLVTAWVAAANVRQEPGERYDQVPRIPLAGEPDTWPAPPTEWGGGPYPGLHCHWLWVPAGEKIPDFGARPPGGPVTDRAR